MNVDSILPRYRLLERYVQWTDDDAAHLRGTSAILLPHFEATVADFYLEIEKHAATRQVITGGREQVERLKGTLRQWLLDMIEGPHDEEYVIRRYRVGWRHVEIGLPSVFTTVALSRMRTRLTSALINGWQRGGQDGLEAAVSALQKRMDLDLALIEEAYQAEHALKMQRTERLITLGQVAGGIAHELRNPLNVIKTSSYYLRKARTLTPEKQLEHLERIERHVEQADGVITALSNFAKMPTPALKPVALEPLVRETVAAESPPPGIHVEYKMPEDLPRAMADPGQLRIVLANLIRNAADAMPGGGRLTIEARPVADGRVEVEVADTGEGIPQERLHQIMEPLFSTKARGLGLGLAIVRSILAKSEGTLAVRSTLGVGSVFVVALPGQKAGG